MSERMTPEEYGRQLAEQAPPIGPQQARAAARILATMQPGEGKPWPREEVRAPKSVDRDGD